MLPVLTGPGGYATSGTTVSDTFRDGGGVATAPAAGLTLVAATVSNNGSPVRGSLSGSGWAVLEDPSGIPAEWVEASFARIVTLWGKQAGAAEPSTVTYTGSGGGHHGLKLFALPATNRIGADQVLRASTGQGAVYGLDLGSTSSASADAFAIAALIANGGLTGTAISDGFGLVEDEARAAVATKELGKVTVAPDWSITTTGRGMSSALAVLYAAQPPAVSLGPDQEVQTGQVVTLTASVTNAGTGPGAGPHTFEFEQTAGTAVTLSGAGESRTFTPSTDGTTTFRSRAVGAGGLAGPWDTVNVVATLSNPVPVVTVTADDTTVGVGDPVTLTATATDPNGTVVSGTWTVQSQPAGAAVTFTDAAVPSTGTSTLNVAGGYVFRFTATDDAGATGYGEVTVVAAVPVGVNTPFRLVLTLPPEATTVRLRRTILGVAAGEVHLHDATGFAPGEIDVVAETPVVLPPTTATVTPSAPAITAGGTVTLTVAADGSTPRAYQWLSDVSGAFEDIPGATGISFTTPALSAAETGRQHQCRVTNAAGSILSNVVTVTVTPVSTGAGVQAAQADELVDSIGVNTHWHYTDRVYHTRYAEVRDLLVASGIRFYRDYTMPTKQATYVELAGLGLRMTAVQSIESETPGTWKPASSVTLDQTLDVAKAVADAGGLIGVEAVNEPDGSSSLDKPTWYQAARAHLADIKAGRDARGMSSVPVVGPGLIKATNTDELGDITQWTTTASMHPYAGGSPPENGEGKQRAVVDRDAALANNVPGGEVWFGEVGYHNDVPSSDTHLGTPEDVAGVYFPRMWLHHFALGIPRSFSYEFVDQGTDGQEFLFGMVRNDLTPKPAYTATKNLIDLCADPGPSFTPGQLDYTITGGNADTQTVLLQKRDGTFLLFVWQATSMWDPTNRVQTDPADVAVTVNLGASYGSVRTYRPNDGTTALTTAADVSSVGITSSEKVTLISVSTAPVPAGAAGAWEPVMVEDYSTTTSLDTTKWTPNLIWGDDPEVAGAPTAILGNEELQAYIPAGVQFSGGLLKLVANDVTGTPVTAYGDAPTYTTAAQNYTSGIISSHGKFDFVGGFLEIRCRMPAHNSGKRGFWPAFWTLRSARQWPPEIDVFEWASRYPSQVWGTVHRPEDPWKHQYQHPGFADTTPDWADGMHTYGMHWKPWANEIDWYIDGVLIATLPWAPVDPMYLIANLAIGGTFLGSGENNPEVGTPFPASLDIEHIGVWQQPVTGTPTVTATATGPGSIDVTRTSVTNGGEYRLEYSTDGTTWTEWTDSMTTTTATITGLTAATAYTVRVTPRNNLGAGPAGTATATTDAAASEPAYTGSVFSDPFTTDQTSGWGAAWTLNGTAGYASSVAGSQGRVTVNASASARWQAQHPTSTGTEARVKWEVIDKTDHEVVVSVGASAAPPDWTHLSDGYTIRWQAAADTFLFGLSSGGAFTTLGSGNLVKSSVVGDVICAEVEIVSGTVEYRVYLESEGRPATPTRTATDATFTSGRLGLGVMGNAHTVRFNRADLIA